MTVSTPRRILLAAVVVLATGGGLTACGSDTTQSTDRSTTPAALSRDLDAVDAAIAAGDDARTRAALHALMVAATRAGDAGRIDQQQADAIEQAATDLLDRLPSPTPEPSPSTEAASPTPSPTPKPTPPAHGEGKPHGKGKGHEHKKHKGH